MTTDSTPKFEPWTAERVQVERVKMRLSGRSAMDFTDEDECIRVYWLESAGWYYAAQRSIGVSCNDEKALSEMNRLRLKCAKPW